jgi:parallel beta-helix repeat protein
MIAQSNCGVVLSQVIPDLLKLAFLAAVLAGIGASGPALARDARTIHVSPTAGNDNNSGARSAPLGSIGAAVAMARSGDTILLEPGVYKVKSGNAYGVRIQRDGTKDAPITLRARSGEAIIDCSGMTKARSVYCFQVEADWWRISGVAVTGATQNAKGAWAVGINLLDASHNILTSVRAYRNQGPGIAMIGNSSNNLLQDCESFANYDPRSKVPGGNADGVQISAIGRKQVGNVISRCKAHDNSDDGFDLWRAEAPVTIERSVSSRNGFVPGSSKKAGDGVGFKLGKNSSGPRHRILRNRAVNNRAAGFDRNGSQGEPIYVDNVAQGNGGGSYN